MNATWVTLVSVLSLFSPDSAPNPASSVLATEAKRIEVIERVSPSVVCVFDQNLRGGGSGVLVTPDGYGVTNYHVVAGLLKTRRGWGGLGDGILYPLEVLGIDVTGDVAMFRLVPPKRPYRFPFARLGDSDRVNVGDTAIAMGNPFMLSDDYSPSVSLGLVTGVHRYQWGVRGNLAYTDCIQVDAPINPGNSGGPLFNAEGEVIGINGRISVNVRGRFNVGFGYAITSNQIRRFMPALRAGLLARHGTWLATAEPAPSGDVVFAQLDDDGPAYKVGIRSGDRLLAIDGQSITSANQVVSILGTYPQSWPLVVDFERAGKRSTVIVRLVPIKPNLRRPFEVRRNVNLRAVKNVLRRHQRSVLMDADAARRPIRWRLTRTHHAHDESSAKPPEHYELFAGEDGMLTMRELAGDADNGRVVVFNQDTARQGRGDPSTHFELTDDRKRILGALFLAYRRLLEPMDQLDLSEVRHTGVDAWIDSTDDAAGGDADHRDTEILEVLTWPLSQDASAKLSFDVETGRLRRARVRDALTDDQAVVTFLDHRDFGGIVWPATIRVQGAGLDFTDRVESLEAE